MFAVICLRRYSFFILFFFFLHHFYDTAKNHFVHNVINLLILCCLVDWTSHKIHGSIRFDKTQFNFYIINFLFFLLSFIGCVMLFAHEITFRFSDEIDIKHRHCFAIESKMFPIKAISLNSIGFTYSFVQRKSS